MTGCAADDAASDNNDRVVDSGGVYRYVMGVNPNTGAPIYGGAHVVVVPGESKAEAINYANRARALHDQLVGSYEQHDTSHTEGESDWEIFPSSWWDQAGNGVARRWVGSNKNYNDHSVIKQYGSPTEKYDRLVGATPVSVSGVSHRDFGDDSGPAHSHPAVTVAGPATAWEMRNHGVYQSDYHPEYWWGHCNGWASYATAEAGSFPQRDVWVKLVDGKIAECGTDTTDCTLFRKGDIEALMTEMYFSDQATFSGQRCNTAPDEMARDEHGRPVEAACRDLNPGSWHIAVVGLLARGVTPLFETGGLTIENPPFIIDHNYYYEVWNYPVKRFQIHSDVAVSETQAQLLIAASGSDYEFNASAVKFRHVKMSYWMISDGVPFDEMLVRADQRNVPPQRVQLNYVLELDASDKIIGGEWVDQPGVSGPDSKRLHPDFFWIAVDHKGAGETADDTGGDDDNPHIAYSVVKAILECANDAGTCNDGGDDDDDGGFDWGDGCSDGSGTFSQAIPYRDTVTVGEIPVGRGTVAITLNSAVDVDVQLIDKATGTELIAWPNGMLSGADEACTTYEGLEYCYSGYNGVGGQLGNEWIRISGVTNRVLVMRAYGYQAGDAQVDYSWTAAEDCVDAGSGSFTQHIEKDAVVTVGDIPTGKRNIRIDLTSPEDVDIQIIDKQSGTEIVAWPNGILNGAGRETTTYQGMEITYSGYNGVGGQLGNEYITIKGEVTRTLTMRAFGYAEGDAQVDYAWGVPDADL